MKQILTGYTARVVELNSNRYDNRDRLYVNGNNWNGNLHYDNRVLGIAFMSGLFAIFLFLRKVNLKNFRWFALYCFVLGALSLVLYFL